MEIYVNGTKKELEAIGTNGVEWTNDLFGNYDALHYDTKTEQYTMTEEELDAAKARQTAEDKIYGDFLHWYAETYPENWAKINKNKD